MPTRGAAHPEAPDARPRARSKPHIDGERMHAVLTGLAGDGLSGRYSLSPRDIGRAADLLASAYREAGIGPVGDGYRNAFPVVTGVELGPTQRLRVRTENVPADAFTPLSTSGSGRSEGELVFVGYAARSNGNGTAYDDLAGLDLRGKTALLLTDLPGQPSPRRIYQRIREVVRDFERASSALRETEDIAALSELHAETRKRIAGLVEPYLRGQALPDTFVAAPGDPMSTLSVGDLMGPIMEAASAMTGPRFGGREGRLRTKLDRLRDAGVTGVVVVRGPRSFLDAQERAADALPDPSETSPGSRSYPFPVVQVRWKIAERMLRVGGRKLSTLQKKIDTELAPRSGPTGLHLELQTDVRHVTTSVPNVLATLPGTDLANEIVLLGAHYDHIGTDAEGRVHCRATRSADGATDAICNGADDNASGSAMVVEVARALVDAGIQPRRTLVFAHFAGEEIGLLGSKALADHPPEAPPFVDGTVVAMINLDMVGRLSEPSDPSAPSAPSDPEDRKSGLAIGGVGSSAEWMPLLERLGTGGMPILYERAVTRRSDHASFYRHDIPVLFFFTRLHDDYHRPGDEIQHINREGMVEIARLVAGLVHAAGDGHPLPFSAPRSAEEGLVGGLPGDNPATVEKRVPAQRPVEAQPSTGAT